MNAISWIFSGIGVAVLTWVGTPIVRALGHWLKRAKPRPVDPPKLEPVTGGPPSFASAGDPVPPPLLERPPDRLGWNPSPAEVIACVRNTPPLQRDDVARRFVGLNVQWDLILFGVRKYRDECGFRMKSDDALCVDVQLDPERYPGIHFVKEGACLRITGTITRVDGGWVDLQAEHVTWDSTEPVE